MITDILNNLERYKELLPYYSEIETFLASHSLPDLETGKYQIHKDQAFILVNEYETEYSKEKFAESHRTYIDIQILVKGNEIIEYTHIDELIMKDKYSEENDVIFYEQSKIPVSQIVLKAGDFAIFFPEDAHKPGCNISDSQKVKKAVIKISVD